MSRVDVASATTWMTACSQAFVPLAVRAVSPNFHASLEQVSLTETTNLTRVSSGASEVFRGVNTIRQSPRDDVIVSIHCSGSGSVIQHQRKARLSPGAAVMYEASAPYTLSFHGQMSEIVLQLPREVFHPTGHTFSNLTARVITPGPALRALVTLASTTSTTDPLEPTYAQQLAESFGALLKAATVSAPISEEPPIDAELLLVALIAYIEVHALDPDFNPAALAHAHHISLRYLQKLMALEGTSPSELIRSKRLEHAQRVLQSGATVFQACEKSGFENVDTFSRAYKRHFGYRPSDELHPLW